MADTTTKTAEALASALEKRAALHADGCSLGALHDAELSDLLTKAAVAIRAAQPQADPTEGWCAACVTPRVCARDKTCVEHRVVLAARPPVAPPAPAARREPGWIGPMVNDATPQAEPVAADGFVLMPVKLTPEIRAVFERCESERDLTIEEAWEAMLAARPPVAQQGAAEAVPFQKRVDPWLMACFGETIARDKQERSHRFIEEALELVQACGCTASEAHQLVDYVYGRPVGERAQEVGGVMVTLAALCLAHGIDMHDAAEVELARIWTKVEAIRAKQAAKPKHSPLPIAAHVAAAQPVAQGLTDDQIEDCIDEATRLFKMRNRSPGGQQITSYDSWNHWFARAIERALSTTHPAQADEGDTKVSADEEGV